MAILLNALTWSGSITIALAIIIFGFGYGLGAWSRPPDYLTDWSLIGKTSAALGGFFLVLFAVLLIIFFVQSQTKDSFSTLQLVDLQNYIQTTPVQTKEEMYNYFDVIAGRFAAEGDPDERQVGPLLYDFNNWLKQNPEPANDMLDALNDLTGIPTRTAQDILFVYAKQVGLNPGESNILLNALAYNIVSTRLVAIQESFGTETLTQDEEARFLKLTQSQYLPDNNALLKFLSEIEDIYAKSGDTSTAKEMSSFNVYLTFNTTDATAIRNALNFASGNPKLAIYNAIQHYANLVKLSKSKTGRLQDAFLNDILKARLGPVSLNPLLKHAPDTPYKTPWAPTFLRRLSESFSTAAKTQLSMLVQRAHIPDNRSALNFLRKVANYYIQNGDVHEAQVGREIHNLAVWLESRPQEQTLLREAMNYPNRNPAFTMRDLINQYTQFTDRSFEVQESLNRALIYDLVQLRHGPRY